MRRRVETGVKRPSDLTCCATGEEDAAGDGARTARRRSVDGEEDEAAGRGALAESEGAMGCRVYVSLLKTGVHASGHTLATPFVFASFDPFTFIPFTFVPFKSSCFTSAASSFKTSSPAPCRRASSKSAFANEACQS